MDFDVFTEGIEPGGLRSRGEIGILICYMLDTINRPFLKDDLIEIIQDNALANYFETTNSISELLKNNNIEYADEKKKYIQITKNGKLISSQLNTTLSLSVRQKASAAAARVMEKRKIESENPVTIEKAEGGGYNVNLRITDGMRDLMSMTVFVPTITEANHVKRNFHKNPERMYAVMLAAVIGDKELIRNALEEL